MLQNIAPCSIASSSHRPRHRAHVDLGPRHRHLRHRLATIAFLGSWRRSVPLHRRPSSEDGLHLLADLGTGVMPIPSFAEQSVVRRVGVAHGRADRQVDGLRSKLLRRGRSADAAGVLPARVRCDALRLIRRAAGKPVPQPARELRDVLLVLPLPALRLSLPSAASTPRRPDIPLGPLDRGGSANTPCRSYRSVRGSTSRRPRAASSIAPRVR